VGSRISIGDGEGADGLDRLHVLFVDNFDSFTYNLVEYVSEHAEPTVLRNTATLADVRAADPDAIVISPGRGRLRGPRPGLSGGTVSLAGRRRRSRAVVVSARAAVGETDLVMACATASIPSRGSSSTRSRYSQPSDVTLSGTFSPAYKSGERKSPSENPLLFPLRFGFSLSFLPPQFHFHSGRLTIKRLPKQCFLRSIRPASQRFRGHRTEKQHLYKTVRTRIRKGYSNRTRT